MGFLRGYVGLGWVWITTREKCRVFEGLSILGYRYGFVDAMAAELDGVWMSWESLGVALACFVMFLGCSCHCLHAMVEVGKVS
jgi:hypothetical protein